MMIFLAVLIACWSLIPSMKVKQTKSMKGIPVLLVNSFLCFLITITMVFLLKSQKATLKDIKQMPKQWWLLSLVIAALTTLSAYVYIRLCDVSSVSFLAFAKPLSLITTFVVANYLLKNRKNESILKSNRIFGIVFMMTGMFLFSKK